MNTRPARAASAILLAALLTIGAGPSAAVRSEYAKRKASLEKSEDAKDLAVLASWCLSSGLKGEGLTLYGRLLKLDPDHAGARKALGFVRDGGEWVTAAEKKRREGRARLEKEAAGIREGDLASLMRLASRADKALFKDLARTLYERVAAADPDHAAARRGLRQTRFEGSWQDDEALAAAYVAADSDERRKALAEALKAGKSELTAERLERHRAWAAQPKGRQDDLPLEGKGYKTIYLLDVPGDYTGLQLLPLVVYLHGGGNAGVVEPGEVIGFGEAWRSRGWISAFPKCPNQPKVLAWNYPEAEVCVLDLVDRLRKQYPVDPRRIYLSGSSMGGGGTLCLAARHPDLFAAAGALMAWCGKADPNALQRIPLFIGHGSEDKTCPVEMARALDAELTRLDSVHRYVEYPGLGHALGMEPHGDMADWLSGFVLEPPAGKP